MLRHIGKLLWNTRRTGVLLLLQIFLAFVVLFGIFSFAGSALADYREQLGFRTEDTYLVDIYPDDDLDSSAVPEIYARTRREVADLPGVHDASLLGFVTPFGNSNMGFGNDESGVFLFTRLLVADEHLSRVMEVPLARGRWYTPEDTLGGRRVMVVNEAFVESNFPGGDLVDTSFLMFGQETTVLGVVEAFKYRREFETEEALAIMPINPYDDTGAYPYVTLLVHAEPGAPAALEQDIHERVSEIVASRGSVVQELEVLRERTSRSAIVLLTVLLSICAFLVANVALGLFGILINAIAKRRGEIGLRKALGATGASITTQFTLEVVLIAVLGIALGSLVAVQIPLLELLPLDTKFYWWGGLAAAALILALVVLCALLPSGQAARIHPAVALRQD